MSLVSFQEAEVFLKVLNRIREKSYKNECSVNLDSMVTFLNNDGRLMITNNYIESDNDYLKYEDTWKSTVFQLMVVLDEIDGHQTPEDWDMNNPDRKMGYIE